jgi:hypothetical protein
MRPHGHAQVNPRDPRAFGVCDRCYRQFNLENLRWQFDYRANELVNLRILVCDTCMDVPQDQLRPKATPPDPVPVSNPRPENYTLDDQGVSSAALGPPQLFPEP